MLEFYLEKGAKLDMPPDTVGKLYTDGTKNQEYRKSPFIIQAASTSNWPIFSFLLKKGCKISDQGYIGFSKKKKNQVVSNALGGAAFNGRSEILKNLLTKQYLAVLNINEPATEKQDFAQKGTLTKEFTGYTPLMLSIAGGGQNVECTKLLVSKGAEVSVKDQTGNTLLHIAALSGNNDALEFLLNNSHKLNVFERNEKGETPLSIAQEKKDQRAMRLLEEYAKRYGDQTKQNTDQLLNDLMEEEEKEKLKKMKNKEKNKRQKIRQLAQKDGVTYEVMEEKLKKEKELKKAEEERKKREDEEKAIKEFVKNLPV